MTREEAIRELKADYCGNRIICELYPDQCNREDCEIWLAIKALAEQPIRVLETQPEVSKDTNVPNNDCISRKAVKYKLTALVNELEEIFSHIREHNVDRHRVRRIGTSVPTAVRKWNGEIDNDNHNKYNYCIPYPGR